MKPTTTPGVSTEAMFNQQLLSHAYRVSVSQRVRSNHWVGARALRMLLCSLFIFLSVGGVQAGIPVITPSKTNVVANPNVSIGTGVTFTSSGGGVYQPKVPVVLAGTTAQGYVDATGTAAKFYNPTCAIPDGVGNVYVADEYNHCIRKIVIATGVVTTFAGVGGPSNSGTNNSSNPRLAKFNMPTGLCYVGGKLYVADCYNHLIREINMSTGAVSTLAGISTSNADVGCVDGVGLTAAKFAYPRCLTTDGSYLYVGDLDNFGIRKIDIRPGASYGNVTTLFKNTVAGATDGSIAGNVGKINKPYGIYYRNNCLYIADKDNNKIRKLDLDNNNLSTYAGTGISGFSDNLTSTSAKFALPYNLTFDDDGNMYVVERTNNSIRKVDATGNHEVSTFVSGSSFNEPLGISYISGSNELYVADFTNNRIQIVPTKTGWSVDPELPGLSFNDVTGAITGIPTEAPCSDYVVTAKNNFGSTDIPITICVKNNQTISNFAASATTTYGQLPYDLIANAPGSGDLIYTVSGDPNVITISNGKVSVVGVGTCTITATKVDDERYYSATATQTLTVLPKPVSITGVTAADKTYDNNTTATTSGGTLVGLVGSDAVGFDRGTAKFASKDAGTAKTVTATLSSWTLNGADAGKYTLTGIATTTATIIAK